VGSRVQAVRLQSQDGAQLQGRLPDEVRHPAAETDVGDSKILENYNLCQIMNI
jgi:hypothetical protein